MFADASKVHRIEHAGQFFKSRGPLNVVRSPQNGPAILQAGTSAKGRDFAARYADAIFAIQPRAEDAAAYFADIKGRMAELGRNPEECKILFGLQPIIGATEAEARALQEEHNSLVPAEGGMAILSAHLDFDLSRLPPDALMVDRTEPELQRLKTRYRKADGTPMTVREVGSATARASGCRSSSARPAALPTRWRRSSTTVGGDGFMLSPIYCPGAIERFVDEVVPRAAAPRPHAHGICWHDAARHPAPGVAR